MSKIFKIVVLAKQVPDTRNVGKNAMKEDGTVNRAALPAIFNPEDMNALEQALRIKDKFPGTRVELLTMGPLRAADIIREGYFRGADGGVLLTDRKFAGADTLATSYALSMAIRKINPDIIISGRQAIDGDTAQVGPQVAEKLGISLDDLTELLSKINVSTVIPLEEYMKTEVANSSQVNPFENIEFEESKQALAKAINLLPEKEKMVVTLYYYEELTLKEISLILKLSEARVSQLHTKAVVRLKGALANKNTI